MIWYFTPYSLNRKLFEAWDNYMNLVSNPEHWVCMMDGDILFFFNNFGHEMQEYIKKYPDTGIFSCYASRTSNPEQRLTENINENPDILLHRDIALQCKETFRLKAKDIHKSYGHLMLLKKSTWTKIRPALAEVTKGSHLYDIDTTISRMVRRMGMKIRVMESVYVLHYFRHAEGASYTAHLK